MSSLDLFNTTLLDSHEEIDLVNKRFYGRYNYPWPPLLFQAYPPGIAALFLNQDIGCWNHNRIPLKPKIWVAGCGTNQAVIIALKFPEAEVYATDISAESLRQCKKNAQQTGVSNLQLEEKSINDIEYEEEFDYIICTGVVHHNACPGKTLGKISRALKKNSVLEIMVYNYYHRLFSTACQKAIRTFYNSGSAIDLETELLLVKELISDFPYNNMMGEFLRIHTGMHEAEVADRLIQPIEYSYTIATLEEMLSSVNLEYILHCQNQFDVRNSASTWNIQFKSDYLRSYYDSLPDSKRWQISNLLMFNDSPMLWFYVQRKDGDFERKSEQKICEEFLETKFRKNSFLLTNYILNKDDNYKPRETLVKHPAENVLEDPIARKVLSAVRPECTIKDIFHELNIKPGFYEVNDVRIKLTTSGYPFLLAVSSNNV